MTGIELLKQRRKSLGVTQLEAARRAGMPYSRWVRIELGYVEPRGDDRSRMARALATRVRDLWPQDGGAS